MERSGKAVVIVNKKNKWIRILKKGGYLMKVFKMNDFDWVAAENEEQAKDFYHQETEISKEEIELEFIGEVPLTDTMLIPIEDLPPEERDKVKDEEIKNFYGEKRVYRTFEWVINRYKINSPCVIASTEY